MLYGRLIEILLIVFFVVVVAIIFLLGSGVFFYRFVGLL